jgi:hypothetical protein
MSPVFEVKGEKKAEGGDVAFSTLHLAIFYLGR